MVIASFSHNLDTPHDIIAYCGKYPTLTVGRVTKAGARKGRNASKEGAFGHQEGHSGELDGRSSALLLKAPQILELYPRV
jgi:hypothetical protein